MKSDRNEIAASLSAGLETASLRIDANAKAFKELISGIYQNKSYAITRETMANAVDSHVAAGIPERPFQLHLPTEWKPEYSIRDFGVSMDHDTVMGLYSTLFQSTKDDPDSEESNKFVGKFGLGSKSPFAYTDAFQVTAFLNGEKRIYDIFFDKGMPQIALLMRGDTDEENGILISFGVNPDDCSDFEKAATRSIEGLDVIPEFTGKVPELIKREVTAEGTNWKLFKDDTWARAEARQGTVIYPLNFEAVIDCPDDLRGLFQCPLRFEFDIGELDVVTSREALSYDQQTSKNIIKRLTEVFAEIAQRIKDDTAKANTYWEFNRIFSDNQANYPRNILRATAKDAPTFKGKYPSTNVFVNTKDVCIRTKAKDGEANAPMITKSRFGNISFCKFSASDLRRKVVSFRLDRYRPHELTLDTTSDLVVVTEDISQKKRYPSARIKKIVDNLAVCATRSKQLVWIRHIGNADYALKRLFVALGQPTNMEVINLLDIEHSPPARSYDRQKRAPFKILARNSFDAPDEGAEAPKNAWFVPMRNGDIDFQKCRFAHKDLLEMVQFLEKTGVAEEMQVLGIPASSKKLVINHPDWVDLTAFLEENLPDLFDEQAFFEETLQASSISLGSFCDTVMHVVGEAEVKPTFSGTILGELVELCASLDQFNGGDVSKIQKTIHRLLLVKEARKKVVAVAKYDEDYAEFQIENPNQSFRVFDFDAPYKQVIERQEELLKEMGSRMKELTKEAKDIYPLIDVIYHYSISAKVCEDLLNYIEMKNTQLAKKVVDNVDKEAAA